MFPNILSKEQVDILPLLKKFSREFYLVGGTAIALQIGHRQSIDFDMFKLNPLNINRIIKNIEESKFAYKITRRVFEQLNIEILGVKMTFFQYPYSIKTDVKYEGIPMPDLLTLAAMKAFALGKRAKWKDYVDLYFILKDFYTLKEISNKAEEVYGQLFSDKLFYSQLAYHKDINYSEEVEYLAGFEVDDETVKNFLIDKSIEILKN